MALDRARLSARVLGRLRIPRWLLLVMLALAANQCGESRNPVEPTPTPAAPVVGIACGVERWAVKTLSDPLALQVDVTKIVQTTIKELNELPAHCTNLPSARTFPEEFVVYEVVGRVTFVRLEDDRDYHVAVADPADPSSTLVTEVTDTACAGAIESPHRAAMGAARGSFVALLDGRPPSSLVGTIVRLRGVGFFDFDHRQNGRSRSCIELHPVIAIERVQ